MQIGDTIRFFRELKGYSQQGLADSLGVSQKKISRIENGTSSPSMNFIEQICDIFELDIDFILHVDKKKVIEHIAGHINQTKQQYSTKQLMVLYQDLLKEKERYIIALEEEVQWLRENKSK